MIKSNNCWKKSYRFRTFYHIFIRSRNDDVPPFFITLLFYGYRGQTKCMCLILCVCVCMRYWMDSIYNWMFLSSLTIILPSMTTFFNLFAALNGYYFCFCLFYIAMFFCPVFTMLWVALFMLFFRLYVFFVIALDQIYSLFAVSFFVCLCVFKSFPHFFPTLDYTKYTFLHT